MVEFSEKEQKCIDDLFSTFDKEAIEYVVPRGYRNLPASVPGGDIDIVVNHRHYFKTIEVCRQAGFMKTNSKLDDLVNLLNRGLSKPYYVANMVVTEPHAIVQEIADVVTDTERGDDQLASQYDEYKMLKSNVMVHLSNHLGYKSPYNGKKIRVDPKVEEKMYMRAEDSKGILTPSPPDELAHLICRGVFDHEGDFPSYYIKWCDNLKDLVLNSKKYQTQFEQLLNLIFFKASQVVLDAVNIGNYDEIKQNLIQFDGY